MIQPKQDYNYYLERDRVSLGVPPMNSVKAKIKHATVNKSFSEPNVVIAGTPAKVVKRDVPSWNGVEEDSSLPAE